jgi:hypothetical protein
MVRYCDKSSRIKNLAFNRDSVRGASVVLHREITPFDREPFVSEEVSHCRVKIFVPAKSCGERLEFCDGDAILRIDPQPVITGHE